MEKITPEVVKQKNAKLRNEKFQIKETHNLFCIKFGNIFHSKKAILPLPDMDNNFAILLAKDCSYLIHNMDILLMNIKQKNQSANILTSFDHI